MNGQAQGQARGHEAVPIPFGEALHKVPVRYVGDGWVPDPQVPGAPPFDRARPGRVGDEVGLTYTTPGQC